MSKKDWTDALREKDLFEGAAPSPASWEAVGRRVRRAAALRRGGITAAALLPVVALLLWAPWHQPAGPAAPADNRVAQQQPVAPAQPAAPAAALPEPVAEQSAPVSAPSVRVKPAPAAPAAPVQLAPAAPAEPEEILPEVPEAAPEPVFDAVPETIVPDPAETAPVIALAPEEPFDPFAFDEPETGRHRPHLSVGVRGGTGSGNRDLDIRMADAPQTSYLLFLNSLDPQMIDYVKSNGVYYSPGGMGYSNFAPIISDPSNAARVSHFRHDLPLSLGLSVRLDLTPRIGLESGLDYTYLHSREEEDGERLDQRLHFLGIPLRADVRLWSAKGFDVYAGLGGKVEKCVYAILGVVPAREPKLQLSGEAFAGIQYRLGAKTSLYLQPSLSYYFTKTELVTYRTENPLCFTLQAGLRFDL